MSTTYEQAIKSLELARRLALGSQFTTTKKIKPEDKLIIRTLKKYGKLSDSYKKLVNHFANARQLIIHLQKDLQIEKQDKNHIQKELDDTLAILNKPTTEMGTQTELTAEQISQMEKDLAEQTTKITQLTKEQNELTNQINQKANEINQLKEQAKDLEPNPVEKKLIKIVISSHGYWADETYGTFFLRTYKEQLETGKIEEEIVDWNQLKGVYSVMRKVLMDYIRVATSRLELRQDLNKEVASRNQLQTKYDMEVRN